jgi:hypothetical protein
MHSAVPGLGESLRFAQRMGIGRYVPCFVIFTDIGASQIDLMPIAHMSPTEAYGHVRGWIDDYYEQNQPGRVGIMPLMMLAEKNGFATRITRHQHLHPEQDSLRRIHTCGRSQVRTPGLATSPRTAGTQKTAAWNPFSIMVRHYDSYGVLSHSEHLVVKHLVLQCLVCFEILIVYHHST